MPCFLYKRGEESTSRNEVGFDVPRTGENSIAHHNKLGDDTQNIQMGTMRKEKVPQLEYFGQWWRAGTEGEDGGKGVELGMHALGKEVVGKLVVHDGEALVDESETLVHAIHGTPDVAGAFARQEAVEGNEGFRFAARGVQEGRAEHVHPLHIDAWLCDTGFGAFSCGSGWARLFWDGRDCVKLR